MGNSDRESLDVLEGEEVSLQCRYTKYRRIRIQQLCVIGSVFSNFWDPDQSWIRIQLLLGSGSSLDPYMQQLCGSGSVFRMRIRFHTGKNRKNESFIKTKIHHTKTLRFKMYNIGTIFRIRIQIGPKFRIRIQIHCSWTHNTDRYTKESPVVPDFHNFS